MKIFDRWKKSFTTQEKVSTIIEVQKEKASNNIVHGNKKNRDNDNIDEPIDEVQNNNNPNIENNLHIAQETENILNFDQNEHFSLLNVENDSDCWEDTESGEDEDEKSNCDFHQNIETEIDPGFNQEIIEIRKWAVHYNIRNYKMGALMKILRKRLLTSR